MTPHASLFVTLGIPTLALIVSALIALAIARVSRGSGATLFFILGAGVWLAFSGALAGAGALSDFSAGPPPLLLIVIPTFALPIALALSPVGKRLADQLPLAWLVAFHGFRLPLELVMHVAAREGTMPEQMTFTGHNFDIVTGGSALLLALAIARGHAPRTLVIAWNLLGSALLATIVVVAIASLPLFHAYGAEPSHLNTWVAFFPFIWLPAVLVSSALFGHVVLWRRLLTTERASTPTNRSYAVLTES